MQDQKIADWGFEGNTSIISTACASIFGESIIWKEVKEIFTLDYNYIKSLIGEDVSPRRKNASVLWVLATRNALRELQKDSEKDDLAQAITANFSNINAEVALSGDYPGWTPMPDSSIVDLMKDLYVEMYREQPNVLACHAGLECGILGTNYPEMEMISFGPNIRGAHSPDEKVQISSVQKFWDYTLEALKRIPKKHA